MIFSKTFTKWFLKSIAQCYQNLWRIYEYRFKTLIRNRTWFLHQLIYSIQTSTPLDYGPSRPSTLNSLECFLMGASLLVVSFLVNAVNKKSRGISAFRFRLMTLINCCIKCTHKTKHKKIK